MISRFAKQLQSKVLRLAAVCIAEGAPAILGYCLTLYSSDTTAIFATQSLRISGTYDMGYDLAAIICTTSQSYARFELLSQEGEIWFITSMHSPS
eukprot:862289-Pyramimonas_sp.AAC.1